jgi:4-amino-4-deoxy-L-arabinose transferase-like glycosyltransferase
LPILLLAVVFGYFLYRFCKKRFGSETALLALFLFALSPNLIAHSRFVTTDLGIAAFIFFSFYSLFLYFEKPGWQRLWLATLFFALVLLAKFSAVILYPFFGLLAVIAVVFWNRPKKLGQRIKLYIGGLAFIFAVSFIMVWLFYIPHTWNMPLDVQDRLIISSLPFGIGQKAAEVLSGINHLPFMKSIVQYLLGMAMVFNRVQGGNTTYLLGEVTNQSFPLYFPITYLIKTPVPMLFLAVVALMSAVWNYFKKTPFKLWTKFGGYAQKNFVQLSFFLFILFYAYISITGNLNLGIRHLFPIIPMIFVLVAKKTVDLIKSARSKNLKYGFQGALSLLLVWYAFSNFLIYPSYVAYFNELTGGPQNADRYVSDSNVDWGQDLRRLHDYVRASGIEKIAVDYFGGGDPKYYFCDRAFDQEGELIANSSGYDCSGSAYVEWHAENGRWDGEWIAVSETFLTNDIWWSSLRGDEGYSWLREMEPVAKIGYSIYVYYIQ